MNQTHVDADADEGNETALPWQGVVVTALGIFGILVAVVAL